jgi:hypothetical protein
MGMLSFSQCLKRLFMELNLYTPSIMEHTSPLSTPQGSFDDTNPLRADAMRYSHANARGKQCHLVDNTGQHLPEQACREILQGLIENDLFGFRCLSPQGGNTIDLERRESSHIQVGDDLYRLVVYHYEARIEPF